MKILSPATGVIGCGPSGSPHSSLPTLGPGDYGSEKTGWLPFPPGGVALSGSSKAVPGFGEQWKETLLEGRGSGRPSDPGQVSSPLRTCFLIRKMGLTPVPTGLPPAANTRLWAQLALPPSCANAVGEACRPSPHLAGLIPYLLLAIPRSSHHISDHWGLGKGSPGLRGGDSGRVPKHAAHGDPEPR